MNPNSNQNSDGDFLTSVTTALTDIEDMALSAPPAQRPVETPQPTRKRGAIHCLLTLGIITSFALAGWTAFRSPIATAAPTVHTPEQSRPESVRLHTTPIEQIRLGQRVTGRNPLREQTQAPSNITPEHWRAIRLTMHEHGVRYDLAFLRSLDWLKATGAEPGTEIHLHLPEMGLDGPALVESIDACPPLEPANTPRPGEPARMLVTGTMRHLASNILDVSITHLDEPLGITTTHPIWSETRQTFVTAAQLQPGEHLRSETGVISQVTRITPRRGPPELTYNVEIDGEHVYQVGAKGLLVHNDCSDVAAIGKHGDVSVLKNVDETFVDIPFEKWSPTRNDAWIDGVAARGKSVYVASPVRGGDWFAANGELSAFAKEYIRLTDVHGYRRIGDFLVPRP